MTRRRFINSKHDSENEKTFDYSEEGVLMKNSVSPALYKNSKISGFLDQLSNIFVYLINYTKNIKKWYIISVDPDDESIN